MDLLPKSALGERCALDMLRAYFQQNVIRDLILDGESIYHRTTASKLPQSKP
jgi:hypothetical protein